MTDYPGGPDGPEAQEDAQFFDVLRAALRAPVPSGLDHAQKTAEIHALVERAWEGGAPPSAHDDSAHDERSPEQTDHHDSPFDPRSDHESHDPLGPRSADDHGAANHAPPESDHGATPHF